MSITILTIGHSARPLPEFTALVESHGVQQIADVRRYPASARWPHFNKDALAAALAAKAVEYRHFPALGGRRRARPDSPNTALRSESFRGYADHMQTAEFATGLLDLLHFSERATTALMCAEAVWWQCHRKLLSDVLLVRGVQVRHILSTAAPKRHELSEFAREASGTVTYPGLL